MADPRPDQTAAVPTPAAGGPAATGASPAAGARPGSGPGAGQGAGPGAGPGAGGGGFDPRTVSERLNQAYASTPIVRDVAPPRGQSTADRFKAALATAKETATTAPPTRPRPQRTRKARLRTTYIDQWSVMKTAFLLSIAIAIVVVVAVAVVMSVLNAAGVWESIDRTVGQVVGSEASGNFRIEDYLGTRRVMGFTMVVAAADVLLITVIATLGAFLYNLSAALLGGVEVVLAEDQG